MEVSFRKKKSQSFSHSKKMNSDAQIFKPKKIRRAHTKKYKSHSSFSDMNFQNLTPSKDNTRNKNSDVTESPSRAIGL